MIVDGVGWSVIYCAQAGKQYQRFVMCMRESCCLINTIVLAWGLTCTQQLSMQHCGTAVT